MTIRIPTAARNAGIDAVVDRVDAGSGAGVVEIRTGSQPASANDAATGTLLVTITLNDPAFGAGGASVAGRADADVDPVPTGTGVADGTAGWARCKDSAGTTCFDGSVSESGGGGDFIISTDAISTGLTVRLLSGSLTQPAG